MHIAFFTNTYLPFISGVVRSVNLFRKALTESGNNVFVFAQNEGSYEDKEPFIFRYPAIKFTWPIDFTASIPISPFIDQLLPTLGLDVIHTHHPILLGQAAAHKASEFGLPLVFTFHTNYNEYSHYIPIPQDTVQEFIREVIDRWLGDFMTKCHHVIVPTQSMLESLQEKFGLVERVSVIPTGIELEPYQQANGDAIRQQLGWQDAKILVSIGRLTLEKNWYPLFDALAIAMNEHDNLRFMLIGDGVEADRLKNYTEKLGIAQRVVFTGEIPFDQVPAYLKAADLFGFASTAETQGLGTMEALAAGLPVIAVDAIGTRDLVEHGKQGLLTQNDSEALAAGISELLDNPSLAQTMRRSALRKAQKFDIRLQASRLIDVYTQAIENQQKGHYVEVPKRKKIFSFTA